MRISVIGGGGALTDEQDALAYDLGRELADRGHELVCGGRGGVMAAACRGAKVADGLTIGILPGEDPAAANPYVDIPIVTGMGNARNVLVVLNGEAAVAVVGAYGTLSEIGHALDLDRPVVGLRTHVIDGVEAVSTPREALDRVEAAVG